MPDAQLEEYALESKKILDACSQEIEKRDITQRLLLLRDINNLSDEQLKQQCNSLDNYTLSSLVGSSVQEDT